MAVLLGLTAQFLAILAMTVVVTLSNPPKRSYKTLLRVLYGGYWVMLVFYRPPAVRAAFEGEDYALTDGLRALVFALFWIGAVGVWIASDDRRRLWRPGDPDRRRAPPYIPSREAPEPHEQERP